MEKHIHRIPYLKARPQKRSHIDKREVSINVNSKTRSAVKMKGLSVEGGCDVGRASIR